MRFDRNRASIHLIGSNVVEVVDSIAGLKVFVKFSLQTLRIIRMLIKLQPRRLQVIEVNVFGVDFPFVDSFVDLIEQLLSAVIAD